MIVFYDLETTGLINPHRDLPGIIQIAAVKVDNLGEIIDTFNMAVDPEINPHDWEKGAIRTTGVGPDQIRERPTLFTVLPLFAQFMVGTKVLAGYNILGFDDIVLDKNLKRYAFDRCFPWPPKRLDVMDVAVQHMNMQGKRGAKRPKLEEVYESTFGEKFDDAHDALADVLATAKVGLEICGVELARLMK